MSFIRFICQRCNQPLKLCQPLETQGLPAAPTLASVQGELGETQTGATSREETEVEKLQDDTSSGPFPGDGTMSKDSSNIFTLLGKLGPLRTLSSIQKTARDVFEIISGQKDVDHPLCEECTDHLLEQLDTQTALTELENRNYERCLETRVQAGEEEKEELQAELQNLELEEARLAQELRDVYKDRARVAADLEAAQAETMELEQLERQCQMDCTALEWQQLELQDQLRSTENQLRYAQVQLDRLQKTSVFSATFEIWEEGSIGIINHFRLGCLPTVPVGWNEINAAWGQTSLLLLALSKTIGLEFQRYRLIPCGNHSFLKSLTDDSVELPLFCHGGQSVFCDNKFDRAMMAFLDCMQQFIEEAEKGEAGGLPPPSRGRPLPAL
ncbi:Beclin-1-like protein 1 [Tupaia chinensis]|uniref:Beclin-1-like protein 1 n=1 Tax=Tupaia chinensis TaxID=246437 RepID=L9JG00_TUPCH|nr:Beclin-1-like protein 1 [Tupaia chinensis]